MNEENLVKYYNKFNEGKRLNSRYGMVEFNTNITYIKKYLKENDRICDIGAGMGAYSSYFNNLGYEVLAVELVKHNIREIEKNFPDIKTYLANAIDLKKIPDNSFDIVLLFGPMYHLINKEDQLKALLEAKRIVKEDGYIFVSYIMNDYCVVYHGFIEGAIIDEINNNRINSNYEITPNQEDLYHPMTLEKINELNNLANLKREKIFASSGAASYIRPYLNKLSDDAFKEFINYTLTRAENKNMLEASSHLVDILTK